MRQKQMPHPFVFAYLLQCDCHSSDDIIMGATLQSGEHGTVDFLFIVILDLLALLVDTFDPSAVEDEAGTRTAESLVCRRGNHVTVLKGTWVQLWTSEVD